MDGSRALVVSPDLGIGIVPGPIGERIGIDRAAPGAGLVGVLGGAEWEACFFGCAFAAPFFAGALDVGIAIPGMLMDWPAAAFGIVVAMAHPANNVRSFRTISSTQQSVRLTRAECASHFDP